MIFFYRKFENQSGEAIIGRFFFGVHKGEKKRGGRYTARKKFCNRQIWYDALSFGSFYNSRRVKKETFIFGSTFFGIRFTKLIHFFTYIHMDEHEWRFNEHQFLPNKGSLFLGWRGGGELGGSNTHGYLALFQLYQYRICILPRTCACICV